VSDRLPIERGLMRSRSIRPSARELA